MPQGVGTQILALRIIVTVHEDNSSFRLAMVVTQQNQAKAIAATEQVATSDNTVTTPAAPGGPTTGDNAAGSANTANNSAGTTNGASVTTAVQLNYPFTLLEVHEEIIDNPAKPPPPSDIPRPPEHASFVFQLL